MDKKIDKKNEKDLGSLLKAYIRNCQLSGTLLIHPKGHSFIYAPIQVIKRIWFGFDSLLGTFIQ